jgi:sterol 24-C-methyltransferase
MRSIARFSGATIEGINNNRYQLERARALCDAAGLSSLCTFIEHDFMHIPRPEASYDAAYAFEATCHAPDKTSLFGEIFRVLKPGAELAAYEWCLTDRFDSTNAEHLRIKKDIEEGDGLPDIWTIPATKQALVDAGFEVLEAEDRAATADAETPWYLPISGRERTFTGIRRTKLGRRVTWLALSIAGRLGLVPKGTMEVSEFLHAGADALVAGGESSVFTPMFYFRARKPR